MKVCLVSRESEGGGIGTYVRNLARGLRDQGCRVTVVGFGPEFRKEEAEGIETVRLPNRRPLGFRLFPPFSEPRKWKRELGAGPDGIFALQRSFSVWRWFREEKPRFDAVEVPDWGAEGYHLARRYPVVVRLHTPSILVDELNHPTRPVPARLIHRLEAAAIKEARQIYSPSRSLREWAESHPGLGGRKIEVIPYPADPERFRPGERKRGPEPRVLFCGRLERRKGPDLLVRAVPRLLREAPGLTFTFVGADTPAGPAGGSFRAGLERLASELRIGNHLRFLAYLPPEKIPGIFREHDLCVVPSRYDNFPHTLLEAMGTGLAVAAARTGGIPEIVDDGVNGLLFAPDDAEDLAVRVLRLAADPKLRERLGAEARRKVEREYDPALIAQRTIAFYRDAA